MPSADQLDRVATSLEAALDRVREDGYARGYKDAMTDARARVVRMEFYQAHKEKENTK